MVLLQSINANDIMFRVTDVIFIVSGVITVLTAWFGFKYSISKVNDRIDTEVKNGDEKRASIKREFEIHQDKHKSLEKELGEVKNVLHELEGDLTKKVDMLSQKIQEVNVNLEKMKSEILQTILHKRK